MPGKYAAGDAAAGNYHNLVVTAGGELLAWGNNTQGQIGDGTVIDRYFPVSVLKAEKSEAWTVCGAGDEVDGTYDLTDIDSTTFNGWKRIYRKRDEPRLFLFFVADRVQWVVGSDHAKTRGWVYGQGADIVNISAWTKWSGSGYQVDHNIVVGAEEAEPPVWKTGMRFVAGGKAHSLAITEEGSVLAWGQNEDGLLGTGWAPRQLVPKQIIDRGAASVAAGLNHNIVLMEDGDVLTWGGNEYGQLGVGSKDSQRVPVAVDLPGRAIAVAAGWYHSLVLMESGEVLAWGFNVPDSSGFRTDGLPRSVLRHSIVTIAAGGVHSLALTATGILLAWGGNDKCQLGDGSADQRVTPVPVSSGIATMAAGCYHSLAVDKDNHALNWGYNTYSLPGPGGEDTWRMEARPLIVPLDVETFAFHSVSGGAGHSLAVSYDGEVFAWGGNSSGQVGDGSTKDADLPKLILSPGTVQCKTHEEMLSVLLAGPEKVEIVQPSIHREIVPRPKAKPPDNTLSKVPGLMLQTQGLPDDQQALTTTLPLPAQRPALTDGEGE